MIPSRPALSAPELAAGLTAVLEQGLALLDRIDDATYQAKLPAAFNANIGAHYRHCLDHFQCLEVAMAGGVVDYDARARDPGLEQDRGRARAETVRLLGVFAADRLPDARAPVVVRSSVRAAGDALPEVASSWGREWMYAVAHTVHHYALIAVMARLQHVDVPPGFGLAPSTIRHLAS